MADDEPETSTDYRHHTSVWVAYGDVSGLDYLHHKHIENRILFTAGPR